jgi:hypothetical protein
MLECSDHEEYSVEPIAEAALDGGWAAGVMLSVDGARGARAAKSLGERRFGSRDEAIAFAISEYGQLGSTGSVSLPCMSKPTQKGARATVQGLNR